MESHLKRKSQIGALILAAMIPFSHAFAPSLCMYEHPHGLRHPRSRLSPTFHSASEIDIVRKSCPEPNQSKRHPPHPIPNPHPKTHPQAWMLRSRRHRRRNRARARR